MTFKSIWRRNTLVIFRAERPNNSGKAREIKYLHHLSPIMTLFPDLHLSLNLQTVCTSWTPLWTFQRTPESLHILLQHLPLDLLLSKKLLIPSHSLSRWVLRSHLRLSESWIPSLQRSPRPIHIFIPCVTTLLHPQSNL